MDAITANDTTYEMMPVGSRVTSAVASSPPAASAAGIRSSSALSGSSCQMTRARGMPSRRMRAGSADTSATCLSEQALWPEQQHEDHEDEGDARAVGRVQEQRRHLPGDGDYHRACERPVRVADCAEDDAREQRKQQEPAHFGPQLRVQAVHDAG